MKICLSHLAPDYEMLCAQVLWWAWGNGWRL